MKLATFTYTKADGSISKREVVEVAAPNKFYQGYDVSELDADEFQQLIIEYKMLKDAQALEMKELLAKFDLQHSFRQFKPELMTELEIEHV